MGIFRAFCGEREILREAVVLKLEHAPESPGGLLKSGCGLTPRFVTR